MPNLGARFLSTEVVGELQRKANFAIDIPGVSSNITYLVKSFPLPVTTNEVIDIAHGNSHVKFAGTANVDAGEATFYDSMTLDTEKAIQEWRDEVFNARTEAIGSASGYKRDATVTEYSPDGTISRQWKIEGMWPSSFNPGTLDASDNSFKEVSLTLQWDRGYRIG